MKNTISSSRMNRSDLIGIASAALCTVHCLAAPLVLLLFAASDFWHTLSYVFLGISFVAVYFATKHTHDKKISLLIWGSFALLTISVLLEHQIHAMHYVGYLASAGLIWGHSQNIKQCKVAH